MRKIIFIALIILFSLTLYAEDKPDLSPMEAYKPIYWIFGNSEDQTRLDISFKYAILKHYDSGLFFGYSQYSRWELYKKSSPFKTSDYNPEVFFKSRYFIPNILDFIKVSPYEHMSNGRDGDDNRSLNRCYAESQISIGERINVGLNSKIFLYYTQAKENKDYSKYTRNYETKFFISIGNELKETSKEELYIKVSGWNKGYQEYGFISRKLLFMNPRIYVQYFNGYCSSLLTYKEKEKALRIGIIFK